MSRAMVIPTALSLIAGVTDVTSWLLLGGFFSAHVTGNMVVVAADIVTGTPPDIVALLAIPVFILTTAAATIIARRLAGSPRITIVLFGVQAAFLVAAGVLSFTTQASAHPKAGMAVVIGICAVCGMATQNAYLHIVPPRALSTAVMTGNLVAAAVAATDLLLTRGIASDARARWAASWPLLAGFVAGCLIGAVGATLFGDQSALIPAVLAVLLFTAELVRRIRAKGVPMATPSERGEVSTAPSRRLHPVPRRARTRSDAYGLATMTTVLFFFFAAAAAPSPLLPLLLERWQFEPWLLTFAFAVYALAILVALLVVGRLSDHVGRRPVILGAAALELASMILFLVADNIWVFVAARTMQGLATGAATGAISAAIADVAGERRARLTAILGSVGPLAGLATGAVFAGAIAEYHSDPKPVIFAVLAVLFAVALAGVGAARESSPGKPGAARSLRPRVVVPLTARREFWKAVPIATAVWMAGGFYLSVVGETARDLFGISDEFDTSLLIAGLSATGAMTVVVGQRLHARTGATVGVLLIALGMLSAFLAIATSSTPILIAGTLLSGAGFGMAFAGAVGLVIPHAHAHERGELFSAIYVVNYLAFGVPAIAAGLLIEPLGLSSAVLLYAAAVVAVAVIGVAVQALPARQTHSPHLMHTPNERH